MAIVRCPHCELPSMQNEVVGGKCPSCGQAMDAAPRPVVSFPAPAHGRPSNVGPYVAMAVLLLLVLIGGIYLIGRVSSAPVVREDVVMPAPTVVIAPPPAVVEPAATQPATRPVIVAESPATQPAPAPPAAVVEPPAPPPVMVADADPPKPAPDRENANREEKLNDPKGEYVLEEINDDRTVKLTGRIKTLKLESINGCPVIDASELQAERVIFNGPINGQSTVRINAPNGRVELKRSINGNCTIEINAPGGEVRAGEDDDDRIGGSCKLIVTAEEVELRGTVTGGSRIELTLTAGGKLKFDRLDQGAKLSYRKANANDPEVRVNLGAIEAGATIKHEH